MTETTIPNCGPQDSSGCEEENPTPVTLENTPPDPSECGPQVSSGCPAEPGAPVTLENTPPDPSGCGPQVSSGCVESTDLTTTTTTGQPEQPTPVDTLPATGFESTVLFIAVAFTSMGVGAMRLARR